jgi:hypothetical protein
MFAECVLYKFTHMKLNCLQIKGDKIEVLLRMSGGIGATHCDKACGKNMERTLMTDFSCGKGLGELGGLLCI